MLVTLEVNGLKPLLLPIVLSSLQNIFNHRSSLLSFQDSTTCNPFNVASQKYGGSCLNQSSNSGNSNGCENVLDGNTIVGWESASNEAVNSFIQIGFHTTFVVDKLRIMQKTSSGQQIQEMLLEFSDCSMETVRNRFPSINWG